MIPKTENQHINTQHISEKKMINVNLNYYQYKYLQYICIIYVTVYAQEWFYKEISRAFEHP